MRQQHSQKYNLVDRDTDTPVNETLQQVTSTPNAKEFPLREAHELVRDLMTPNPWIYWADFLFHITLGWAAFFTALYTPLFSVWQILSCVVAILALYRAVIFVHELAHLKKGTFKTFRLVWNLMCGIPSLCPSFTYDGVHSDHHKPDIYGTSRDGEYIPFATRNPREMISHILLSFASPLLFTGRFLLLTPLSYLIPPLRKLVWERMSSLTIDMNYKRAENAIRNDKNWRLQEFGAFLFAASTLTLIALDFLPYQGLILWYIIGMSIFFLNSIRTLAAHAYQNPGEHRMGFVEQYLDSVNISGNAFTTELWAPLGLRYHATHHLFMSMPYHNLGKAQHRLINGLSDNTIYLKTLRNGLSDALRRIWSEASASTRLKDGI